MNILIAVGREGSEMDRTLTVMLDVLAYAYILFVMGMAVLESF